MTPIFQKGQSRVFFFLLNLGREKKKKEKENFRHVSTGEPGGGQPRSRPLRGANPIARVLGRFIAPSPRVCVCVYRGGASDSAGTKRRGRWESRAARCHRFLPCVRPTLGAPLWIREGLQRPSLSKAHLQGNSRRRGGGKEPDCRLTLGRLRCTYLEFNPDFRCPFPSPPLCV